MRTQIPMHVEIPCGLRGTYAAIAIQPDRLNLELATDLPSLHGYPPASSNT